MSGLPQPIGCVCLNRIGMDWTHGSLSHPPEVGLPLEAGVLTDVLVERVLDWKAFEGNFNAWLQYRKTIPHEQDILA